MTSTLAKANRLFKEGRYADALYAYESISTSSKSISTSISCCKQICRSRLISTDTNPNHSKTDNHKSSPEKVRAKIESVNYNNLIGWAAWATDKNAIFDIIVSVNGVVIGKTKNDKPRTDLKRKDITGGLGGIRFEIPDRATQKGENLALLVDSSGNELARLNFTRDDIPEDLDNIRVYPHSVTDQCTIVIPVYNAPEETSLCLQSVKRHTTQRHRVLIINDCSTDPRIKEVLGPYSSLSRFSILSNRDNLGYTKTINLAIAFHSGSDDILLLNSDTVVGPRWVEGLQRAAKTDINIATVTAMSNAAGAFSAPYKGNDNNVPPDISLEDYMVLFRRLSKGYYPTVPTGNGFCMYVRRRSLDRFGLFDDILFPRGYGEENEFCMRVRAGGMRNIMDDRTYVYHAKGSSFKEERESLIKSGRNAIDQIYPEYKKAIDIFSKSSIILDCRFTAIIAQQKLLQGERVLPRALYVISTKTGGTPQTNMDLMSNLANRFETWVLTCDSKELALSFYQGNSPSVRIERVTLTEPVEPITHRSHQYDAAVEQWLAKYDFDLIHIRHIGWHSLSLPRIAREQGCRIVFSFHDYYTVCPTTKLLDNQSTFCAGECTNSDGDCRIDLWSDKNSLPKLKGEWVHNWRSLMYNALIPFCDAFITTHLSARSIILKYFAIPEERFHIIPHGRDFLRFRANKEKCTIEPSKPLRVLIPGNIGTAKGGNIIKRIVELDCDRSIEFHILGKCFDHDIPYVQYHGEYEREHFTDIVEEIDPHIGAIFSIWNETWCHTLTECWSAGLPVVALCYPTIEDRINSTGGGWILASSEPMFIYRELLSIRENVDDINNKMLAVAQVQNTTLNKETCLAMADKYNHVYQKILERAT